MKTLQMKATKYNILDLQILAEASVCVREREGEGSGTIEPTLVALGPGAALDLAALGLRMSSHFDPWHPVFTFPRAQRGESLHFLFVLGRIRPAHSYQRS